MIRWYLKVVLVGLLMLLLPVAGSGAGRWQQVAEADYRFLFKKITRAQLLVPHQAPAPELFIAEYPKKIKIDYFLDVSADKLRELSEKNLLKRADWEGLDESEKAKGREFLSWYRDVYKGDSYQLEWRAGAGGFQALVLRHNNVELGQIIDAKLAQVLLGIWLGDRAISRKQSAALVESWRAFAMQQSNQPAP